MQKPNASASDTRRLTGAPVSFLERIERHASAIARFPSRYVALYALIWTIVSASLDPTVPFDAVEAFNWSRNGEWGTPKNPWLVGFSMWPVLGLGGKALAWYWYASHFAGVAIGMLGVWHLANRLSGERRLAWLAMLSLHLSGAINVDILPYNDNYLLVMLWPWMLWLFVRALLDSPRFWPAFAVVAGLAAMTKYSTFALLGAMFVITLWTPAARRHYRHPAFLIGLAIFIALIAPNAVWLAHHDFAAFRWVDDQITPQVNARALRGALSAIYPVATLALLIRIVGVRFARPPVAAQIAAAILLPPLLPILLYFSLYNGGRISEWLQPFAVALPAVLVACVPPSSAARLQRIARWLPAAGLLVLAGYVVVLSANIRNTGQKFSGIKAASISLEQRWQARYEAPLRYVGHDHVATWLTFYAPGNPRLLMRWSEQHRPNIYTKHIDEADVRAHGALLVGRPGQSCRRESFTRTLAQWPTLAVSARETVPFSYHGDASPIPLCVGFIAPQR
jgi:hypothetical protein